jgi:hypothetical protein
VLSPNYLTAEDLLKRAYHQASTGEKVISPEEISWVVSTLQTETDPQVLWRLIDTLGYATYREYAWVVEPHLNGPDPQVAWRALWVLCEYWGLTGHYLEQLTKCIIGVPWDTYYRCQVSAVTFVEEYLQEQVKAGEDLDRQLLRALVTLCEDDNASINTRYLTCHSLQRALGMTPDNEQCAHTLDVVKSILRSTI